MTIFTGATSCEAIGMGGFSMVVILFCLFIFIYSFIYFCFNFFFFVCRNFSSLPKVAPEKGYIPADPKYNLLFVQSHFFDRKKEAKCYFFWNRVSSMLQ